MHDHMKSTVNTHHSFDLDVQVAPGQELGEVGGGRRRVVPIIGGTLKGTDFDGTVLPGGADWQTIRADGVALLEARYTVKMDNGQVVGVVNIGVRRAAPEIAQKLLRGELVDPALYYFRSSPVFETGPGRYQWFTENVFVAAGERLPDRVRLRVFKVA